MRVALLQVCFEPASHAATLQSVLALIDRAAVMSPPPDLLVLPGACDTGGEPPGKTYSPAKAANVREALADRAREWGVYIAAGLHEYIDEKPVHCAVLCDPNGDRVARAPGMGPAQPTEEPERKTRYDGSAWASSVGLIGLVDMPMDDKNGESPAWARGALLVTPAHDLGNTATRRKRKSQTEAVRTGAWSHMDSAWAVVAAAERSKRKKTATPGTWLCDPTGKILATAPDGGETIVLGEWEFDPSIEPTVAKR